MLPSNCTASTVGCRACPALVQSRQTIVEGEGSDAPLVLFIAEAPGEFEDSSGSPFVGQSGQVLRAAVSEAGLGREHVYFTHAVRCRPDGNRDPSDEEIANCSGWLALEVDRTRPPHVVLLGKVAKRAWARLEGELHYSPTVHELAHPSHVQRNPRLKPAWKEAINDIALRALGGSVHERVGAADWSEGEPDWDHPYLAADTETKELENEVYGNEVVCYQVSDGAHAGLYLPGQYALLRDRPEHLYLHHAKFDAAAFGIDLRDLSRWDDTLLMAYVLREPLTGLKTVGPKYTGLDMRPITEILTAYDYEDKVVRLTARGLPSETDNTDIIYDGGDTYIRRKRTKRKRNFEEALREDPVPSRHYALLDAVVTSRLAAVLHPLLATEPKLERYYRTIEKPIVPILYDAEQAGIRVNADALIQIGAELDDQIEEHEDTAKLLLDVDYDTFKLASPKQLAPALEKLGLRLRNTTRGGDTSVDSASLLEAVGYPNSDELAKSANTRQKQVVLHVLRYRETKKLKETYVTNLLRGRDALDRVHGSLNQNIAATNRLSSSDPNLQNIPVRTATGARIRQAFVAKEGHVLLKADFSALELRILTHAINDPGMRAVFEQGLNPHDLNAERWGIPRASAKNFIFGLAYGMAARKAATTGGIPEERAEKFLNEVRSQTPGLMSWPDRIRDQLIGQGYVETFLGWRNYYPNFYSPIRSEKAAALREAGNMPIQGTAAGLVKLFMIALDAITDTYDAIQLLQVHDEVVLEAPEHAAYELASEIDQIAREVGSPYLSVPLEVEIKIGRSWHGGRVWKPK